jgi:hypothetical protein
MRRETLGLARPLHLDDANARPDHVDEAAAHRLFEASADVVAACAVARQQLVQEGLGLGPLRSLVAAPAGGELRQRVAYLSARPGHVTRLEGRLAARYGEERSLAQVARYLGELALRLLEGIDQMLFTAAPP